MTREGLWVVRHAPVAVEGVCYGQHDVPTTLDAEAAARALLSGIDGLGIRASIEHVWTSPWRRTLGVAEALASRLGVEVHVDARLSELSFGAWEGRLYADLEAADGERFARWMTAWETEAPPGGERVDQLVERVSAWRRDARGRRGLAITHAGPIRALRALARGARYRSVIAEKVEHLRVELVAEEPACDAPPA